MRTPFLLLLALISSIASAQNGQKDQSLSPYFLITSTDSTDLSPDFPLKLNRADVHISGVIADVEITQVYLNKSSHPLEAVYVFPASTRAAVYAMEMQIGRKTITAVIKEKKEAKAIYTEAKQAGQTASLLEQDRPNIFRMQVANIMPGDSIVVRMSYTELLIPTDGIYEFVYPTVVGPRYTRLNDSTANQPALHNPERGIPYTKKGVDPLYDFGMNVSIASPVPFEKIESSTHKILLSFEEKNKAGILLAPEEKNGGNRDFILHYKLAGPAIKTGMMTYEGKEESFFMLMIQPPARVSVDSIPPREYIFVMDVSGSMNGYPIETSKNLLRNLVGGLRPDDLFNVVQFAGGAALLSPVSLHANAANIDSAITFINKPQGGGGTELKNAMEKAMAIPRHAGYSRTIVIATDGLISAEAAVFESIHSKLDSANVFAFGIGSSCNRYLIEGIAFAGKGEPVVVPYQTQADSAAEVFRRYISSPVLTNIKVDFGAIQVYDAEPMQVPDLFAQRPIIITGKYRNKPVGKITVTGITGKEKYTEEIILTNVKAEKKNKAIKYLWARERVKLLDYKSAFSPSDTLLKKQITEIGLKYSILTSNTSFVAVYKKERNKEGVEDSTVVQPVPLPENMNDLTIISGGVPASYSDYGMMRGAVNASMVLVQAYQAIPMHDVSNTTSYLVPLMVYSPPLSPSLSIGSLLSSHTNWLYAHSGRVLQPVVYMERGAAISGAFTGNLFNTAPFSLPRTWYFPGSDAFHDFPLNVKNTSATVSSLFDPESFFEIGMNSAGQQSSTLYWNKRFSSNDSQKTKGLYFAVGEQFSLYSTDMNDDQYQDLPMLKSGSCAIGWRQYTRSDTVTKLFISHLSGQISENTWGTRSDALNEFSSTDRQAGLYWMNKFNYTKTEDGHYYTIEGNLIAGYSERKIDFGQKHFSAAEPFIVANGNFNFHRKQLTYITGLSSSWYGGKTGMSDLQHYDNSYLSQSAVLKLKYNSANYITNLTAALRVDHDSRYGSWISPSIMIARDLNDHSWFHLNFSRLRSRVADPGSIFPLLMSSRTYSFDRKLLPEDGWMGYLMYGFSKYSPQLHFKIAYRFANYTRMVVADMDSEPGKVSVYNTKGTNQHLAEMNASYEFRYGFRMQMYYQYLLRKSYSGLLYLDEPLLPRHQAGALVEKSWESTGRWKLKTSAVARYYSRQRLPGHGWSEDFTKVDFSFQFNIPYYTKWMLIVTGENLLNFKQSTLLYGNIATSDFDSSLNWGPSVGRSMSIRLNYRF
jgi:Ca-activated chloride channel homolog